MDLSTGKPGAGVKVSVSGYPPVRTDKDGRYSVSDLPAGEYTISLEPDGQGALSGGPVLVNVDGQHSATVDMTYRSQPQPLPTDTPQPAAVAEPPPSLPKSGAPAGPWPLVVAGLGLLLTLAGGMLRFGDRQP
jgi:hypothetical protein